MTGAVHELAGYLGVSCIVSSYLALQLGRLRAEALGYSLLNALGAALVLASLAVQFNAAAASVEGFWLAISLYGVIRSLRRRRP